MSDFKFPDKPPSDFPYTATYERILTADLTALKEENKRLREALERLTRAATELGVDPLDGNLQDKVIDAIDAAVTILKEE